MHSNDAMEVDPPVTPLDVKTPSQPQKPLTLSNKDTSPFGSTGKAVNIASRRAAAGRIPDSKLANVSNMKVLTTAYKPHETCSQRAISNANNTNGESLRTALDYEKSTYGQTNHEGVLPTPDALRPVPWHLEHKRPRNPEELEEISIVQARFLNMSRIEEAGINSPLTPSHLPGAPRLEAAPFEWGGEEWSSPPDTGTFNAFPDTIFAQFPKNIPLTFPKRK